MRSNLIIWPLVILLTGCGFHLRGIMDMPQWLTNVAVIAESQDDLASNIVAQLQGYKVKVNPNPALASYWLIIQQSYFQRQIISVSSSTTPRQYQLTYTVLFKLQDKKGKEVIPVNQVVITRQITMNSDRILGSDEEETIIRNEMVREAISQVLNRLTSKV